MSKVPEVTKTDEGETMPVIYFNKEEMRLLHALLDNQTMLGQGDYTNEEWATLDVLHAKLAP